MVVMVAEERLSDVGLLVSDGARVILLKPSEEQIEVLRVYSAATAHFELSQAKQFVGFDGSLDGWVIWPSSDDALKVLEELIQPAEFTIVSAVPRNVQAVVKAHLKLHGTVQELCAVSGGHELTPNIQRLYDRLGADGHLLVGAPMTFDKGRASFRLAVRSYRYYISLQQSNKMDHELVGQIVAWNVISQSYVALEKFCALLYAIGAGRVEPKVFSFEYLKFGRTESDLQASNVTTVMSQILGRHGPKMISDALSIPLCADALAGVGLADTGIESQRLIDIGRSTRDIVVERFRGLARIVVEGRTQDGGPLKSVPAKTYGAFRHGFAAGFPVHLPNGVVFHGNPDRFVNEADFLEYHRLANFKAEILYLGERGANGDRPIESVRPIIRPEELKVFVRITYWASFWTYEMAKYARSLFGSVDVRFPYLINARQALNETDRALLQARLDQLEGMS